MRIDTRPGWPDVSVAVSASAEIMGSPRGSDSVMVSRIRGVPLDVVHRAPSVATAPEFDAYPALAR